MSSDNAGQYDASINVQRFYNEMNPWVSGKWKKPTIKDMKEHLTRLNVDFSKVNRPNNRLEYEDLLRTALGTGSPEETQLNANPANTNTRVPAPSLPFVVDNNGAEANISTSNADAIQRDARVTALTQEVDALRRAAAESARKNGQDALRSEAELAARVKELEAIRNGSNVNALPTEPDALRAGTTANALRAGTDVNVRGAGVLRGAAHGTLTPETIDLYRSLGIAAGPGNDFSRFSEPPRKIRKLNESPTVPAVPLANDGKPTGSEEQMVTRVTQAVFNGMLAATSSGTDGSSQLDLSLVKSRKVYSKYQSKIGLMNTIGDGRHTMKGIFSVSKFFQNYVGIMHGNFSQQLINKMLNQPLFLNGTVKRTIDNVFKPEYFDPTCAPGFVRLILNMLLEYGLNRMEELGFDWKLLTITNAVVSRMLDKFCMEYKPAEQMVLVQLVGDAIVQTQNEFRIAGAFRKGIAEVERTYVKCAGFDTTSWNGFIAPPRKTRRSDKTTKSSKRASTRAFFSPPRNRPARNSLDTRRSDRGRAGMAPWTDPESDEYVPMGFCHWEVRNDAGCTRRTCSLRHDKWTQAEMDESKKARRATLRLQQPRDRKPRDHQNWSQ